MVVAPPEGMVDEGAVIGGVVVMPPPLIDGYVQFNSGWYYWHPGFHCWVHAPRPLDWRPPARVRVYHGWNQHPMFQHRH